ncbi:MAG: FecCD family ABC transporter permease [Pseudonocardia sp.]
MTAAPPRPAVDRSTTTPRAGRRRSSWAGFSLLLVGLGAATVLSVLLAVGAGPVSVPLSETVRIIGHHLAPTLVDAALDPVHDQIVWNFRLPRALLGAVVGAGLTLVGTTLQAAVRNPLADPYLLGVSSGAALGAVLVLVLGSAAVGGLSLSAAAFIGALVSTGSIYVLGRRDGRITPFRLVLAGVALAYLFQAGYSYLLITGDPRGTQGVLFWLLGSLGSAGWSDLGLPALVLVLGSGLLLLQARSLNSLLAGDETAVSLGLDVNRFRVQMLIVTSLLVGVMVAVSGAIAFVGLIVPHLARLVVGADHRRPPGGRSAGRCDLPGPRRPRSQDDRPANRAAADDRHRRVRSTVLPLAAAQARPWSRGEVRMRLTVEDVAIQLNGTPILAPTDLVVEPG